MTNHQKDLKDVKFLDEALTHLRARFDSVRIFVTRDNGDARGTFQASKGSGNAMAQLGGIEMWLHYERIRYVSEVRNLPEYRPGGAAPFPKFPVDQGDEDLDR